jgi:dolichyl-phosphate-mannose-protein mannosyltransferase
MVSNLDDMLMSSLFQAGLHGSKYTSMPLEIAYGSIVSIKQSARGGALLHSHTLRYPQSENQQVTCYPHKDENNDWLIDYAIQSDRPRNSSKINYIKNGDVIRLS